MRGNVIHRASHPRFFGIKSSGKLIFLGLAISKAVYLALEEIRQTKTREIGEWTLAGTGIRNGDRIDGWRVTSVNRTTHQILEYWVQNGRLFHVQSTAEHHNHQAQFVIGHPVNRVDPSLKAAILDTVGIWSSDEASV
jgi:hypothetical protein